ILHDAKASGRLKYYAPIAETAGMIDLIAALISDLKRQEQWDEQFAELVERHSPSEKNRELAMVYDAYQRLLNDHSLYDAEGRFWWAREMMRAGRWGPFDQVREIVVDGFTDFTYTQHQILHLLAERANR